MVYAARGSGIWINVGRTVAFASHQHAAQQLLNLSSGCRGTGPTHFYSRLECNAELPVLLHAAQRQGYDSVQFVQHRNLRCMQCSHEIALLGPRGLDACPAGVVFRRGARAQLPCHCVSSAALSSEAGQCSSCAEWSEHPGLAGWLLREGAS